MTKQSGLGDRLFVGGYNLSGDVGSLGAIGGGPTPGEVTGIDKLAKERIGYVRDGRIEFDSWFNPSAGQEHDVLSALPTADVGVTYCRGAAVGNQAAFMVAKQVNYDLTRGDDGSLQAAGVSAQANGYGLEWGLQYTAGAIDLTNDTEHLGTSIDHGGATTDGLTMFIQLGVYDTTLAAIAIQQSSDNGVGDAWADILSWGISPADGGPTTVRVTVAGAVERYTRLRVNGVYPSIAGLQVSAARRTVATAF